ncbi:unannotated protein [freshwater metagenome]|uniref:Unannotated protein n=1 Tax=freshwater metagenome TaxID=449393 RepID=A0A6J7IJK9_9ZZZZ
MGIGAIVSNSIVEKSIARSWISSCTWVVVISCIRLNSGAMELIIVTPISQRARRGSSGVPASAASAGTGIGSMLSQ